MDRKVNIRRRIIISTIVATVVFIILTIPVGKFVSDFGSAPEPVYNATLSNAQNSKELQLNWDKVDDIVLRKIVIKVDGTETKLKKSAVNYNLSIEEEKDTYNIDLYAVDYFGRESAKDNIIVTKNAGGTFEINREQSKLNVKTSKSDKFEFLESAYLRAFILSIVLLMLTGYIITFPILKSRNPRVLNLLFYPAALILSPSLIFFSYLDSDSNLVRSFLFTMLVALIFYFIAYFVFLTVNILNNSVHYELPLEQAAKASQFVFSLMSTYATFILFFGAGFSLIERIVFISPFIFYFSFTSIVMLKDISLRDSVVRAASIALVVLFALIVLSMWPANYIYIMLSLAIIFYVLLSISLENKGRVTQYVILEYSLLIGLVTFVLVINSSWGILGTLL